MVRLKRSMRASCPVSLQFCSVFRMTADIPCGSAQMVCHAGATRHHKPDLGAIMLNIGERKTKLALGS